jgi:ribosomal-protein-alanine N-acetyltransferase
MSVQTQEDPGSGLDVRPPYRVRQLTIEDGMDIAMWRYPGPWAVYDSLEPPHVDEGYWAVKDATDRLVGFCCFGEPARVPGFAEDPDALDVALGMQPQLVGRGLGQEFARAVVDYAHRVADGRRLRCVVAEWNEPGQHSAEAAGFTPVGRHEVPGGARVSSYLVYAQD